MESKEVNKRKKQRLPKGFFVSNGQPTLNAVIMFFLYWTNVPADWNKEKLYMPAVEIIREYFGVYYGFDVVIVWALNILKHQLIAAIQKHQVFIII